MDIQKEEKIQEARKIEFWSEIMRIKNIIVIMLNFKKLWGEFPSWCSG